MAAHPRHVPAWFVFVLGAMAAFIALLIVLAYVGAQAPKPRLFALDLRLPKAPSLPENPSLPPPPIPVPK